MIPGLVIVLSLHFGPGPGSRPASSPVRPVTWASQVQQSQRPRQSRQMRQPLRARSSPRATVADDGWISSDKAKHLVTSALLESIAYSAARLARVSREGALVSASAMTAGVGIGKELYDWKSGGDPSFKDLVADGAGIGAAVVLLRRTAR